MGNIIESVNLAIYTNDGRRKEIKLEVWQVGAIALLLGLHVKLPDIENYTMSDESVVKKRLNILLGKDSNRKCVESVENGCQHFTLCREDID